MGNVELSFYLFSYNVERLPPLEPVGGSHGDGMSGVGVGVSVRPDVKSFGGWIG